MVTSLPVKNNTITMSADTMNGRDKKKNVPSQNDTMKRGEKKRKKLTSCDIQKNRGKKKTNSTKQLNGTKHNVLPLPNKRWLGYGPLQNNSVTLPGSGSAANSM